MSAVLRAAGLVALAWAVACGGVHGQAGSPGATTREHRPRGADAEAVGLWLLEEMIAPGGTAADAARARTRLDGLKGDGLDASLAAAMWDETHGRLGRAADGWVRTLHAAAASDDAIAPLAGLYASHHLVALKGSVPGLYARHEGAVEGLLRRPGHVGWRAVADLAEWSAAETRTRGGGAGPAHDAEVTRRMGCAKAARIAGPFGHGAPADRRTSFAAEQSPWPPTFPDDPRRGTTPRVLRTERHRCLTASTERTPDGVFYIESFFDTPAPRDLLVAAQGALAVWVDGVRIVDRDLRAWGVWQRFGGAVRVPAGRHRVLARLLADGASLRLLNLDGTSADLDTDVDASRPFGLVPPVVLADPNPIAELVAAAAKDVVPGASAMKHGPVHALLAAHAAYVDGLSDVAATLAEPLVAPKDAAPVALLTAALFARGDVAYTEQVRRIHEKELHARAAAADPGLYYARAWLVLDDAESRGPVEGVEPLRALAEAFPEVSDVRAQLARVYGRLGWRAERLREVRALAQRFPDDRDVIELLAAALDEDASGAEADAAYERLKALDPDAEVDVDRALARHDWKAAARELARIEARRPDRKDLAARIADVLMRSGDASRAIAQLDAALAKAPDDAQVRLRLADHAYAAGDGAALRKALASALAAGSKGSEIRDALDLLEGATALEPYRVDGRQVIREFLAWEKAGHTMDGTAARILDYAATWVHPDGSSEMLEHEILRMQSQEAVQQEAEQKSPEGLVLRFRVIKPDGSILEPEPVAGKPTLTMPHLEVGDYLEIEHVTQTPGDEGKGLRYRGPHWFFREADKGYWRSQFVVLLPKDKPAEIETVGSVPAPVVRDRGTFVERTWRVDDSPPAPEEPDAPNPREFLPSVRIGWGVTLPDMLARYVDAAGDETPIDPRLRAAAAAVVAGIPPADRERRARALHTYVRETVQDGQENDGRRVVSGRSGSRQAAYVYLLRALGIPVELAVVKSRVAMPPAGPMSEVEVYDNVALRIDTGARPTWTTVRDKFAPFGYVPAELRGQSAYRLVPGTPPDTTPTQGAADGVRIDAHAVMKEDGSATLTVTHAFLGRMGIGMRSLFDRVPEGKRTELVETKLLGANVPGARLEKLDIENKDDVSAPFVLRMTARVPQLARPVGSRLVLKSLFPISVAQIASLPARQTPLLLGNASHMEVSATIEVPPSLTLPASLATGELRDEDRSVVVKDRVEGRTLVLSRVVDIPAGRVLPGAPYERFVTFTQSADRLLERELAVTR